VIVNDIVDHIYNILFLRQAAIGIVDVARKEALKSIFGSFLRGIKTDQACQFADDWFIDPEAKDMLKSFLSDYKLRPHHIDAEAVRLRSGELEQIERMIASMESRLRRARQDIGLYRESRRVCEQLKSKSAPKELPFIQPSELSDDKQDLAQDGLVKQSSNDEQESNEGNSESMSHSEASSKLGAGNGNIQS
jgi:hypothetical protein